MGGVAVEFLCANGAMLLGGVTALLLAGCVGALLCRSPLHRQRVCELSLLASIAWAVVACVPLPRWDWERKPVERSAAAPKVLTAPVELRSETAPLSPFTPGS